MSSINNRPYDLLTYDGDDDFESDICIYDSWHVLTKKSQHVAMDSCILKCENNYPLSHCQTNIFAMDVYMYNNERAKYLTNRRNRTVNECFIFIKKGCLNFLTGAPSAYAFCLLIYKTWIIFHLWHVSAISQYDAATLHFSRCEKWRRRSLSNYSHLRTWLVTNYVFMRRRSIYFVPIIIISLTSREGGR